MKNSTVPGTVLPYTEIDGGMFSRFEPMIRATDGLSLGQICTITGLEPFVIQNWIKREFVPHPVRKKYRQRHLARILLINALRDSMQIERIGLLMERINGDVDDESDDIISEERLYDDLCEVIRQTDQRRLPPDEIPTAVEAVLSGYDGSPSARARLQTGLTAMAYAAVAGRLIQTADALADTIESLE